MTNGEKIQTILDIDKDCTEVYGKNGMMTFSVPQDWWNAEYKEPVIRDNVVKNELNRVKDELGVASELEKNSKELEKDFGELDCISRKAVLDGFEKYSNGSFGYGCVWDYVKNLPSVTPQEPKGHWITHHESMTLLTGETATGGVVCSECGYKTHNKAHVMLGCPYNYCPNCGADMREVEE